jgi:hypothetical protein
MHIAWQTHALPAFVHWSPVAFPGGHHHIGAA